MSTVPTFRAGSLLSAALLALAAALAPQRAAAQQGAECGSTANAYGPYDYRTDRDRLKIVEDHHFTVEVENLIRAHTGYLGGDLDYTLRAFPNHHRALIAITRYADKLKMDQVPRADYSVRCYYMRAISFRPDDTTVRMLFAMYLNARGQRDDALKQMEVARGYAADNAFTHYNLGLVYADLGDFDRALEQAHTAMSMGFPRTELKDRLVAANRWAEPASAPR